MAQQAQENLEMLVMISRLLSSKLDLGELLTTVMQLATDVVGAERASLFLLDETTNELYFDVALGLEPDLPTIRLKIGEGIAGLCAKERKPIIINDTANDPRHSQKVDQESGFVTRSIMSCPMIMKGRILGVVQAINHIDGPFTEKDQRNFEAFAAQAAIAIENARLFASINEEKRRLQVVFRQTREGMVVTNTDNHIVLVNDVAQLYFGRQFDKTMKEAISGMEIKPAYDEILSSPENIVRFELTREKPKKLLLDGSAIRLFMQKEDGKPEPEGWLWMFRDVTQARAEEKMSRNFLSLISHKLKTPLAPINGYSQMLLDDTKAGQLTDFAKKAILAINQQGMKLAHLVEMLLNYITIEELDSGNLRKSQFDISEPLKEAVSSMSSRLEAAKVKCELKDADTPLTATGDSYLMREVFRAVIDNAVKFNQSPEKNVMISCCHNGNTALISIADNGPGIPPEELEKIFDKFYQVESSFTGQVEGWGLGLAFTKKVVEAHCGRIIVKSQLQKGSIFTITLPIVKSSPAPAAPSPDPQPPS